MTTIVLFGGLSDERHVSVASAQTIVRALGAPLSADATGHEEQRHRAVARVDVVAAAILAALHELRGKNLVCWCAPKRCHAEVLIELANR